MPLVSASSMPCSTAGMNSLGIAPPLILLTKSKPFAGGGLEVDHDVAVLTAAARLADESALDLLGRTADRLPIGDLGAADVGVHAELAQQAVDDHLEVQLAHPVDQRLARLLLRLHLERGVLLGQPGQARGQLLLVGLRLRLDRDGDHRLRELDRLQHDRSVGRAQGVAGARLLQADAGADVAGEALLDLLTVVGVHHQEPADPLGAAAGGVEDAAPRGELARVDAEVGQLADVGIGHHLEGERRERGRSRPAGARPRDPARPRPCVAARSPSRAAPRAATEAARRSRRAAAALPCS